jgi:hypothetical protein
MRSTMDSGSNALPAASGATTLGGMPLGASGSSSRLLSRHQSLRPGALGSAVGSSQGGVQDMSWDGSLAQAASPTSTSGGA